MARRHRNMEPSIINLLPYDILVETRNGKEVLRGTSGAPPMVEELPAASNIREDGIMLFTKRLTGKVRNLPNDFFENLDSRRVNYVVPRDVAHFLAATDGYIEGIYTPHSAVREELPNGRKGKILHYRGLVTFEFPDAIEATPEEEENPEDTE